MLRNPCFPDKGLGFEQPPKSCAGHDMGQKIWDRRAYAGEDVLSEAARSGWVKTGECTVRKTRGLSCLSVQFRKPSQACPSNCAQKQAPTEGASHMDFGPSRRPMRDEIREATEGFGHSSSPVMKVIESVKAWLLSSRYKRSRKVPDPLPSYVHSSVIPIRTGASILQCQPPIPSANGSGEKARESAVGRNSRLSQSPANELFEPSPDYPPSYQKIDPRFHLLGQTLTRHVESGVDLETHRSCLEDNEGKNAIIRKGTFG